MMTTTCGCGAVVPLTSGPAHAYVAASPGCWEQLGLLQARLLDHGIEGSCVVDAFAAQHPGHAEVERRQRKSVAVHLVALCLHHELGVGHRDLSRLRSHTSEVVLRALRLDDWPTLSPPTRWGDLTAAAVLSAPDSELADSVEAWGREVWTAWSAHHDEVRAWAMARLAGERARR